MARLFTAGGTDRLSWGSDAKLDNLAQGSFTAWAVIRRNSDAANMWLMAKSAGILTQGWQFLVDQHPTGDTPGHLRLIVGTSGTRYDFFTGNPSSAPAVALNEHYFVAVVWNGATATFYVSPLATPVVATTTFAFTTGSGTVGADAAAALYVGNADPSNGSNLEFGGDIDFAGAHNVALTREQLRVVQQGCLAYNGGSTTRAAAMLTATPTCVLAGKLASDGTVTDLSATPATGTLTGTDPGTALGNIYVFDAFGDDLQQYGTSVAHDQTSYWYTSGYARTGRLTTLATAGTLWMYRSIRVDEGAQADVGLAVDGAYTDTLSTLTINELSADTFAGLAGTSKTLEFIAGPRSRPGGVPVEGTWPTLVVLDAAATPAAPVEGASRLHYLSESTVEGFFCDPPAQFSPCATLRANLPSGFDGVASYAYGGMQTADVAGDATLRAETAAALTAGNPRAIWIAFGVNDKVQNVALATISTQITALVQAILDTVSFTGTVYIAAPLITVNYEGANTATVPYTLDDLRTELLAIASGFASARVVGVNMRDWVTTAQLDADGTHLTNVSGPIVGNEMANVVTEGGGGVGGTPSPAVRSWVQPTPTGTPGGVAATPAPATRLWVALAPTASTAVAVTPSPAVRAWALGTPSAAMGGVSGVASPATRAWTILLATGRVGGLRATQLGSFAGVADGSTFRAITASAILAAAPLPVRLSSIAAPARLTDASES